MFLVRENSINHVTGRIPEYEIRVRMTSETPNGPEDASLQLNRYVYCLDQVNTGVHNALYIRPWQTSMTDAI